MIISPRAIAWLIIVAGLGLQFPVQSYIDRYRNTLRVTMYKTATEDDVRAVEKALEEKGLAPTRTSLVDAKGDRRQVVEARLPRQEWGRDLFPYVAAVNQCAKVANVVPSLNEQGIPLDKLHELNLQDVGIAVIAALLGGFRKSAANVLWLQSDANWFEGRHYRTVPLGRLVTTLDPQFAEAWTVTCWHLAYNMSVEEKTPDGAASRIREGLEFAEGGLPWNSTRYDLYQEIGWTYYDKLQNYALAAEYFKRAIQHPHPPFLERAIAHAYERIPDIESALFWYNVSKKKYGADGTPTPIEDGAIITITERYLPAWEAYKEGDLEEARRRLKRDWQKDDPFDTIGMHFLARIYENMAANKAKEGDYEASAKLYRQAFDTWLASAKHNASDRLARRRVLTLGEQFRKQFGFPETWREDGQIIPIGFNDVGLPESNVQQLKPQHEGRQESQATEPGG